MKLEAALTENPVPSFLPARPGALFQTSRPGTRRRASFNLKLSAPNFKLRPPPGGRHRAEGYNSGVTGTGENPEPRETMYCPRCDREARPVECGDCHALICNQCGTPLERLDELGIG